MQTKILKNAVITSVLAITLSLVPVAAFAEDGTSGGTSGSGGTTSGSSGDTSGTGDTSGSTSGSDSSGDQLQGIHDRQFNDVARQQRELLREQMQSAEHAEGKGKLAGSVLTRCNVRAAKINILMNRVVIRGTRQAALFNTIATRVEKFYTEKNLSLSNYDALVTAVNDASTKVQTDMTALQSQGTFSCDGSNPKGQIDEFRTALKTEIQDLKALKTAVKDLIVGVKSVAGSADSTTSTGSSTSTDTSTGGTQ